MTCACFLLLLIFPCQSSLCSRYSWVTGRERALLVLHLLMYLGITLHLLLFNNFQWKSSLILLQVHGMPHRKSNCWMSASYRWHCDPSAPRYSQPGGGGEKGKKRAILCRHSLGQGQPSYLGLCVSRHFEPYVLLAKWIHSGLDWPTSLNNELWLRPPTERSFLLLLIPSCTKPKQLHYCVSQTRKTNLLWFRVQGNCSAKSLTPSPSSSPHPSQLPYSSLLKVGWVHKESTAITLVTECI